MSKELVFDVEARAKLQAGIDKLANAVKVTLGPKGRNVVIAKPTGPHISKDGVTVAEEIFLEDKFENLGAQIVKEVASKTNDNAGDGTTTATVLAQAIIKHGIKLVASGVNPMDLKKGIEVGARFIKNSIKKSAIKIEASDEKINQVATISANGDGIIGSLVAEAIKNAGKDGVVTVEEAKGMEDELVNVEGMQIDRGYLSPHFVTDQTKMEVVLDNPYILMADSKITSMQDILNILEVCSHEGRPLLIIAEELNNEVLATLVVNKLQGNLKIAAIKAPGFGDRRKDMLEDLAILTGGQALTAEQGIKLKEVSKHHLGICEKVTITKDTTTFVDGFGDQEKLDARVKQIKVQLEQANQEYEETILQERLAKLTGGVSILYIGAVSEVELKEKKDRVDDALNATKAAIEEGIVPGGGVALLRAEEEIQNLKGDNEDQTLGIATLRSAIEEPLRQIVNNAGLEGSVIVQKVREGKGNYGYNAREDKFEDLLEAGVIDPAKVTRVALENAVSIASLFLTTECAIIENQDESAQAVNPNMM